MFGVSVDGVPVTDVLTSVIGDAAVMMLKLEPLALPTYQVSVPTGIGFAVEPVTGSSSTVTEGGAFSFTVSIPAGYLKGAGFVVKVNGTPITDVNGVYTVTDITENMYITVEGVEVDPTISTTPTDPEDKKERLSGGAIAGIVAGSTAAAGVGGFSAVWFGVQKKTFGDLKNTLKKLGRKIAKKLAKKAKKAKHSDTPETAEIPEIPETPDNEG